ncbi:MAG: DNA methyltransferase [Anaerolineaceae bacterium]
MESYQLPINQILMGDCVELMQKLPPESVDVVFADPPYNLQLRQQLWRPNLTEVDAVNDSWDQFDDFESYDRFTTEWLQACRRVLKPNGTLWVIGTYHNIYRVGTILQDLHYWILNDVVWIKANPMPNFRGVRLTNAHETLIWAQKERGAGYTFNHHALKQLNEGLQMRSDWYFAICSGKERLRDNGTKVHSTQKPLALIYRILTACTQPDDLILDPFFGTGTTGVAAKKLGRRFIGFERDAHYVEMARKRLEKIKPFDKSTIHPSPNLRRRTRLPFGTLLENGLLLPGTSLFFGENGDLTAIIQADGSISFGSERGSIHQVARVIHPGPINGWQVWYYLDEADGKKYPIDRLRQQLRSKNYKHEEEK